MINAPTTSSPEDILKEIVGLVKGVMEYGSPCDDFIAIHDLLEQHGYDVSPQEDDDEEDGDDDDDPNIM